MADWGYGSGSPSPSECVDHANWTYETDVPPQYRQFRYYAHTTFDLPRDSSLLYFISRGVLSHGSIEILNDGTDSDTVNVDVDLLYNLDDVLERVDVCTLHRERNQNGVGIFVSRLHKAYSIDLELTMLRTGQSPRYQPPHHNERTQFVVKVHLPTEGQQVYEGLETDMPLFAHVVGDLASELFFNYISLKTSNTPITIKVKNKNSVDSIFN